MKVMHVQAGDLWHLDCLPTVHVVGHGEARQFRSGVPCRLHSDNNLSVAAPQDVGRYSGCNQPEAEGHLRLYPRDRYAEDEGCTRELP